MFNTCHMFRWLVGRYCSCPTTSTSYLNVNKSHDHPVLHDRNNAPNPERPTTLLLKGKRSVDAFETTTRCSRSNIWRWAERAPLRRRRRRRTWPAAIWATAGSPIRRICNDFVTLMEVSMVYHLTNNVEGLFHISRDLTCILERARSPSGRPGSRTRNPRSGSPSAPLPSPPPAVTRISFRRSRSGKGEAWMVKPKMWVP